MEHETHTADGTLIVQRSMAHGGWNSHCGTEHGTHMEDGTHIVERNMEHTRRMELSLGNGTWNTHGGWNSHCGMEHGAHMVDGTLIVERNIKHVEWKSHCGT